MYWGLNGDWTNYDKLGYSHFGKISDMDVSENEVLEPTKEIQRAKENQRADPLDWMILGCLIFR